MEEFRIEQNMAPVGEETELELSGLDPDELEFMDPDERREALEDAGLDPDDYDY